jgi:hypothetical protein
MFFAPKLTSVPPNYPRPDLKKNSEAGSALTPLFKKYQPSKPTYCEPVNTAKTREDLAKQGYQALKDQLEKKEVEKEIKKISKKLTPMLYEEKSLSVYPKQNPNQNSDSPTFDPSRVSHLTLAGKVLQIIRLIKTEPKEGECQQHMQLIRQKIDEAISSPAYQELEKTEKIEMINFLKHAGYILNTQTEGMSIIEQIGHDAVEQTQAYAKLDNLEDEHDEPSFSGKDLSSITREAIRNTPGYRRDTLGQILLWIVANLKKAFYGFIDEFIPGGYRHFKPCQLDNSFIYVGNYVIGNQSVQFNLGPSVASDNIFEKAHLLFLKKHHKIHYQHSLEEAKHKRGEKSRTAIQKKIAKEEKETFFYWRSSLDGDIWKGKKEFSQIRNVKDYHDKLRTRIAKSQQGIETGFDLGKVFDQEDIDQALFYSQQAFKALVPEESIKLNQDENRRLSKSMLLGFTGFLAIRAMQKLGEKLQEISKEELTDEITNTVNNVLPSMGQACKQDIDRGVIINAVTRAFVEMIAKGSLEKRDIDQIVGMIKFRGLETEDRLIQEDRLEAFLDLFELIGEGEKQEQFISALQRFAGEKPEMSLRFEPSNRQNSRS